MGRNTTILLMCALLGGAAAAQSPVQPYAGQQNGDIKALSAREIADYLAGNGMGLAKAAELNGYPGPKHVLELSSQLELTAAQRAATESLFNTMQGEARAIGRDLVAAERDLDQLFAKQTITDDSLSRKLHDIGALQARLRAVHLRAHLEQARILTQRQRALYAELRGYGRDGAHTGHHAH